MRYIIYLIMSVLIYSIWHRIMILCQKYFMKFAMSKSDGHVMINGRCYTL